MDVFSRHLFAATRGRDSRLGKRGPTREFTEAEPLVGRALAIHQKVLGEDHRDTARSYNNLAGNLNDQCKYAEAEPLFRKALAIHQKVLGEEHPDTAQATTTWPAI